jgi:Cu(I)/Ag(I) efflux system periplasmic protein CusF
MKRVLTPSVLLTLSISIMPLAHAQSPGTGGMDMKDDMKGMDMKSEKKGTSKTHKGSGTVSKVDSEKGTVTIAHGPIASMKWPAMTMTFKVKDKAMLDKLAKDQKVDFEFKEEGKDHVITAVK